MYYYKTRTCFLIRVYGRHARLSRWQSAAAGQPKHVTCMLPVRAQRTLIPAGMSRTSCPCVHSACSYQQHIQAGSLPVRAQPPAVLICTSVLPDAFMFGRFPVLCNLLSSTLQR